MSYAKIGEIVYCEGCTPAVPIAKRIGISAFELIKFHNGKQVKIKTSYEGIWRVTCEACGDGNIFTFIKESVSVN